MRRGAVARFAGAARGVVALAADAMRRRPGFVFFADDAFEAAPRAAVFFAADFLTADFFAAVFLCGALRAAVFFTALRGALRAAAAFFARFDGADFADFVPVDVRADVRAVLLLRGVGLIVISGSAGRAECAAPREPQ